MQWRESVDPGMAHRTVKAAYLGQAAMWEVAGGASGGGGLGAVQSKPQWAGPGRAAELAVGRAYGGDVDGVQGGGVRRRGRWAGRGHAAAT